MSLLNEKGSWLVGNENRIEGTGRNDRLVGTSKNDHIIGGKGNDVLNGSAPLIESVTKMSDTSTEYGFATDKAEWIGEWYAPDGHAVLDETEFGLPDTGRGQVLELAHDNNTSIERSFDNLDNGDKLALEFELALPVTNRVLGMDGVEVVWNGQSLGAFSATQYNVWQTVQLDLEAGTGDGTNTLVLKGTGSSDWWGAVIDNIKVEQISGTIVDNDYLEGGGGNDSLVGGEGRDWLEGGAGRDKLDGGDGVDVAVYTNSARGVKVDLEKGTGSGGEASGDRYESIENAHGSAHGDKLYGDEGTNRLVGRDGDDKLFGREGDDTLLGGRGADHLDGGDGRDTAEYDWSTSSVEVDLTTGEGSGGFAEGDTLIDIENLVGSDHDDVLTGDEGANRLFGGEGNDVLKGMSGNDIILASAGADKIDGGEGKRDAVDYGKAESGVGVNLAKGGFAGLAEGDSYENVEFVYGSQHDDKIYGDDGVNRLVGKDGGDFLGGGEGNDYLIGGSGNDTLEGGEGDDVFLFDAVFDKDVILDFEAGEGRTDRIWFQNLGIKDFDGFKMSETKAGVQLDVEGYGSLELLGIETSDLARDDFIF